MSSTPDLSIIAIIMPILAAIGILLVVVVLIVVHGRTKQIQSAAIHQQSFDALVGELKADHAEIKSELATMQETLNSINKMMREIQ